MMHQGLAPGVEHRKEPDLGAQMTWIRRDGPQRLGDRPEEEAIDDGLVLVGDGGDRRGHREDDVEVVDGEQVRSARIDPRGAGEQTGTSGNGDCDTSCTRPVGARTGRTAPRGHRGPRSGRPRSRS